MRIEYIALAAALALSMSACGGGDDAPEAEVETGAKAKTEVTKEPDATPDNLEDAFAELGKALGGMGEDVETVAAKDLKVMLPEEIGDLERKSFSAKKSGAFGIKISSADAVYRSDAGETVNLSIKDIGAMQALASLGMDWVDLEVDEETEHGFTRSTEYKGHKSFQSFSDQGGRKQASMSVFVGGRFVIDANGNVDFSVVEDAIGQVPMDDLEALHKQVASSQ